MSDGLFERLGFLRRTSCPSCGEDMPVDLYIALNEKGELQVWHEGICTHCLSSVFTPLPEVVLVMDETSRQIMAN